MELNEGVWKLAQEHFCYTDGEMKLFRENPRNEDVLSKWDVLGNKTIIAEVIESHGCNSLHKVGDKFFFDGGGSLITDLCPKRICHLAIGALSPLIFAAQELVFAGIDPNEMRFRRFGCPDVGVRCGGFGHVVMELTVQDRNEIAPD